MNIEGRDRKKGGGKKEEMQERRGRGKDRERKGER